MRNLKKTVYIGLPCYNEEKDINTLLDRILIVKNEIKEKFKYETKIFCVNDGSSDKTEKIIKKRKKDGIVLINHDKNKGLGEAMKTIILQFKNMAKDGDYLVVMDADNSHNPKYILDLIEKKEHSNSDIIIASRYQKGATISGLKKHRIFISNMAKLWYSLILKIPNIKDYTCGYRLYTYEIINKAIEKYEDKIITQSSFACMMEFLYKLYLSGAKINEIPFSLEYEKKIGNSKMKVIKTSIDSLKTTIKISIQNKKLSDFIPYILILGLSILLMFMSSSRLKNIGLFWDAAVYLNVGRNILNGKILYKEIVDNKGPILYFINAFGLELGGQLGVCIVEFLFIFISLLFMYKCIKLINNKKIEQIVILFTSITFLGKFFTYGLSCEEYALTFSIICLYECLKHYKNGYFTNKQCILIGILCALSFFIRPNLITLFMGFGFGIGIKLIIEKKYKDLFKYIIFSLIGFGIISIFIFLYLFKNNCTNEFLENVFLLNMTLNKCGFLNSLIMIIKLMPITFIVIIMNLLSSLYELITKKDIKHLGIIFCIIITILFNCISATIYPHYLISFIPIILLAYSNLFSFIKNKWAIILISIITFGIGLYNIYQYRLYFNVFQPNLNIIEYIKDNTHENDKIAVIGFYDEIYYLTNRDSVSNYTYILSNNAFSNDNQTMIVSNYLHDIITNKPKIIVEDYVTIENGVKPYIDITDYDELKEKNYLLVSQFNSIRVYQLKN